ncbi:unnamed protein product [Dibothriocephalus latus]|uniref:Reverse transcriptase domain-containing protein n=1 Tax=Dibothriocephalus latus TaxID=60516 RepID=A0A3P7PAT0_DIBLA|nr:unnamed protein product [Dibothriocephalus latus]
MQLAMGLFAAGCANFGLIIRMNKTAVMPHPLSGADYNIRRININAAELKNMDNFAYLGRTLSQNTRIDNEMSTKLKIYKAGIDEQRPHKRLSCNNVAGDARRKGRQKRRYKNTLEKALKCLQNNTSAWEELAQD